mmetsp:Transcript_50446/g.113444  ORF Transcript_50446/g.113444 Transcript_50446/m.113444 type:complete len:230 (-) Transcript_50446:73-762(-)
MASEGESEPLTSDIGDDGLPQGVDKAFSPGKSIGAVSLSLIIPRLIGLGIAFAIWSLGAHDAYKKKAETLAAQDLGYLYFGIWALSVSISWVNGFPIYYKDQIMKFGSGNLRANMLVYKVNHPDPNTKSPYVVLEEGGSVGRYNRANRSLHHMVENSIGMAVIALLAGFVFPFPEMVLVLIFSLGRILHQLGYAQGYGKHAPGFVLAVVSHMTSEGLVLIAALMALGAL